MRIRTLLQASLAVAIAMVIGLAATSWIITAKLTKVSLSQERAQTAANQVSELLVLAHEYALYSEERAAQQWKAKHAAILLILQAGAGDAVPAPPEALAEAMLLTELFQQLVSALPQNTALQSRQKNLLLNQLHASTQILADSIYHWGMTTVSHREKTERAYRVLAITIPILMFLILAGITFLLNRRVLHPLLKLHQAVQATAKGDLSVRCATETHDEFGELSRTFDAMAIDLVAGLKQEISERKKSERELELAREAAFAGSRAKSEFLSNMSHEIRTPMNGIMGMAQLLEYTPLTDEQKEYLGAIRTSSESLLSLINDVLDLSKIESGKIELEQRNFRLRESIDNVIKSQISPIRNKGLSIRTDISALVPDHLTGDQLRLKQILLNLLGNAIKFTSQGGVSITVTVTEQHEDVVLLKIGVTDSGIGIRAEAMEKIFKPFVQADGSTTRQFGGTGLGLAICTRLTELMGGSIWVESREGRGSTFFLQLPFMLNQAVEGTRRQFSDKALPLWDGPPLRILIVDDQDINLTVAARILQRAGHTVVEAHDGREALEQWEESPLDVILMDIQMPVMSGIEATLAIRESEQETGGHITIIAVTARAFQEEQAHILIQGFDGYVAKPYGIGELFSELKRTLQCRKEIPSPGRT